MQEWNMILNISQKEEKIMILDVEINSVEVVTMKELMIKVLKLLMSLMHSNIKKQLLPNLNSLLMLKDT
jgi:hypothetical protein